MDCKTEVQSASALTGLRRFSSNQTLLERCLPSERDDQDAILAIAEDSHKKRDEDRASDWMVSFKTSAQYLDFSTSLQSSHLMRNPPEVLERIFILASNGKLAYVNRKFNQIANSTLIRALWLIERYGPEKVLSLCWRWRFLRRLHMEDTTAAVTKDQREWKVHVEVCARKAEWLIGPQSCLRKRRSGKPCHCQRMAALADGIQQVHTDTWWTKARRRLNFHLHERRGEQVTFRRGESLISSERVKAATFLFSCEIEQTQILMVLQLLELGASVGAGCDMALRVAARWGHLNLMTVLLERGADPNTIVFFERTVGIKIKNKGKVGGGVPGDKKFVMDPPIALIDFQNQILVDAGLIAPPIPPPPPPSPEELEAMMEFRRNFSKYHQVPLLLQAVQASHTRLAKLLLSTDGPRPRGITNKTVTMALKEALELNKLDICNVLVEYGKVQPSADMIQSLVSRAGMWRLLCGLRNKLTHLIVFAVNNLSEEDFTAMSASLIRSSAEIGSVEFLKACIARGADVNVWNGHALHASIYNGNLDITMHLLKPDVNVNTDNFGTRQKAFCIGLIIIEGFALLMFSLLLVLWVMALATYIESVESKSSNAGSAGMDLGANMNGNSTFWTSNSHGSSSNSADITLGELSGMAIPSSLALIVMYRLVPLHKMCIAYSRVCAEDRRRKRELRRRREEEARRQQELLVAEQGGEGQS